MTRLYTSKVSSAQRCQVISLARARPFLTNISANSLFSTTLDNAEAIFDGSSGSIKIAASFATSGIEVVFDATTGVFEANASNTGKPKPSYNDGKTSKVAD